MAQIIMMTSGWRKYLWIVAILILVAICLFVRFALKAHEDTLVKEKAWEKQQDVALLCGIVDKLVEMDKKTGNYHGYEEILIFAIQNIEANFYSTYAQVFDEKLTPLISLNPGVGGGPKHNPLDYPEFIDAVNNNEFGSLMYWYETSEAGGRNVHITYRWVPTDIDHEMRYLIAVGASKHTIIESIDPYIIYGAIVIIIIAAAFIIAAVIALCHLGYIYEQREGEKWRGIRGDGAHVYS